LLVAKSGSLIKGYGDVRRKTVDVYCRYIDNIIWPISMNLIKDLQINQQLLSYGDQCLESIMTDSEEIVKYKKELKEQILYKGAINGQ